MNVRVREATVDDVSGFALMRALDEDAGPADARMARYLVGDHHPQRALSDRVIVLAELDGVLVGYSGGHRTTRYDCDGELQYLYVAPSQRRTGVAGAMVEFLAAWFERHDIRRVCVDVDPLNERARAFYAKHGAATLNPHWMVWDDLPAFLGVATRP